MTAAAQEAGLDLLLSERLRGDLADPLLARQDCRVVFDAPDAGVWTLDLAGGRGRVHRGSAGRPDLVIRAPLATLTAVVSGSRSGTQAFLDGALTVRGDLALSLALDGLWGNAPGRPTSFPRSAEVVALGVRTRYLEAGPADAPPVILLHGLGATNASLLPTLADLATDHRVLAPDLPGHGATAAPAAPYTPAWFASWVEAFQGLTGSRGGVLLGNSLGGRIALEAGLRHPQSVRALVLLTPSPAFRRLRQLVPFVRLARPELGGLPLVLPHRLVVEAVRVMFSDPDRLPKAWYDAAADECRRVLRSRAHRVAFFSCARQIYLEEAYGRRGFWDRLPALEPPALFVWGAQDRLVPSSFARYVSDALPGAESVVLSDCGHVPQFERPADTHAVIRGFLAAL